MLNRLQNWLDANPYGASRYRALEGDSLPALIRRTVETPVITTPHKWPEPRWWRFWHRPPVAK